jgi:hypothetical protein
VDPLVPSGTQLCEFEGGGASAPSLISPTPRRTRRNPRCGTGPGAPSTTNRSGRQPRCPTGRAADPNRVLESLEPAKSPKSQVGSCTWRSDRGFASKDCCGPRSAYIMRGAGRVAASNSGRQGGALLAHASQLEHCLDRAPGTATAPSSVHRAPQLTELAPGTSRPLSQEATGIGCAIESASW